MIRASLCCVLLLPSLTLAAGNLLRNGDFQDDWQTLLPELKNHHWNYTTEVFNRRDYNPDGWRLSGKWQWLDADKPRGQRRLQLSSPSRVVQSVNGVLINNPKKLEGWPDAGGYPAAEAVRSKNPLAFVRDLTFRVRLSTTNLPAKAATITVAWSAASPIDDPLGSKRIVSASAEVPEGSLKNQFVEVKLPAAMWLEAAKKDPLFAKEGPLLPLAATCVIVFADKMAGTIELAEAILEDTDPASPNLLPNGGFENINDKRYSVGWSKPHKYRYFAPGVYYIFNTWHNSNSYNRGQVFSDELVPHQGKVSLGMIVPSGDETCVVSDPILLNQKEARLIEVRAWVKTDQLSMMQIDAEDENGKRIDGFNFIHKNPLSIGTDDWRQVRQVFRPSTPLKSLRLKLCARGMNGFTLDDTGHQPQQNVCGTIWWDDVTLHEPESSAAEIQARGGKAIAVGASTAGPHLAKLDLGERRPGANVLTAELRNLPNPQNYRLRWAYHSPEGETYSFTSGAIKATPGKSPTVHLSYAIKETSSKPYSEYHGTLSLLDGAEKVVVESPVWFALWSTPMDLELGALYLRPEQKQFVRVNLPAGDLLLKELRLEVLRRGTGEVVITFTVPATPEAIEKQRTRIPDGLRDDFRNMILADLDVSFLPLQPFNDPQRNHVLRVTAIDRDGKAGLSMTSQPFCRLAHDGPQAPIQSVKISKDGDFLINDKPWMPWGVTYGHTPVYDGPADSAKHHDLANLKGWGIYDRHGGSLGDRSLWDANCLRHVETGRLTTPAQLEDMLKKGLYASTVFVPPPMPGKPWPDDHLKYLKTASMIAAISPGPEETFGYYSPMTPAQLDAVKANVEYLRKGTGKPVMVGHGGYWTRLEFEKVPFFDIYDPETEPWYPAPLHTDLRPLVEGKAQTVWLRPQMYESVPYERWRYHVFVELMRGARGWQIAHGPGDASTFRGLHAELRHLQPAIYSKEKPPEVKIEPHVEHMVRKLGNKTTIIAATTHGMTFGNWRTAGEIDGKTARATVDPHIFRDESDGYHAVNEPASQSLVPHGIQNLIEPCRWPTGSKLVTWVNLDEKETQKSLVALVKADGRWSHAASWGKWNLAGLRANNEQSFWFLRTFYRHARGFLGWGDKVGPHAMAYLPATATDLGVLPKPGEWVKVEVSLDKLGATDKLLDGVAFLHEGGRAWWSRTALVTPDGKEQVVFGVHEDRPEPSSLEKTKIHVAGLKKGTKIKVVFEDREIVAEEGYFVDDFRGVDLYQRYGGERSGYGNTPVALHIYEVPN